MSNRVHFPHLKSLETIFFLSLLMNIPGAFICYKTGSANDSRNSEMSCDLLLVFVSPVILDFGLCRDSWPYFCSFQDHLRVLKCGLFFDERRGGSSWVHANCPEQRSNLLVAFRIMEMELMFFCFPFEGGHWESFRKTVSGTNQFAAW
jgi:hypothetical protein